MITNYFQELYKNLIRQGFGQLREFSVEKNLDDSTRFLNFLKEEGSSWHVVVIVNMQNVLLQELLEMGKAYEVYFENLQKNHSVQHIFITFVMVTQEENMSVKDFINEKEPFILLPINKTFWGFDLEKGEIFFNKNGLSKAFNLENILKETYKETKPIAYSVSKNMEDIRLEIYNENLINNEKKTKPYLIYFIMLINIIMFIIMEQRGGPSIQNLIDFGAIHPILVFGQGEYYRLITATFVHAGLMHLVNNMLGLYIFGSRIEGYLGRIGFLSIYFIGGIVGSVFSVVLSGTLSVGASGAVFALVGACAVVAKLSKSLLDGLNFSTLIIYILISLGFGLRMSGIDNFGHLGGLIGGILLGIIIYSTSNLAKSR